MDQNEPAVRQTAPCRDFGGLAHQGTPEGKPEGTPEGTPEGKPGGLRQFWHRLGSPKWFYHMSGPWQSAFAVLAVLLIGTGMAWGLAFAPPDYQQGNSFRIIYVHVARRHACPIGVRGAWRCRRAALGVAHEDGPTDAGELGWLRRLDDGARPLHRCGLGQAHLGELGGFLMGRTTSTLVLLFLYFGL